MSGVITIGVESTEVDLVGSFIRPRGIVLVGASRDPTAISGRPARFLREWGFPGTVTVVNPSAGTDLEGFTVVASLDEIPAGADLAMLLVGADSVVPTLAAIYERGMRRAIAIASGFEGTSGARRRDALIEFLVKHPDLRLIGPNCNGVLAVADGIPLCFSSVLLTERPRPGPIGLVTQSGAIGNALLLALGRRGVGISHWFSTGDEVSVGALELIAGLLEEESCDCVGTFLEAITDRAHLDRVAALIRRTGKRVVALRTASSTQGAQAAFGHTGRVVGDGAIARAALQQAGIEIVDTLDDLCDVLTVLSILERTAPAQPTRVGIVTVSGGAGVMAADAISRSRSLRLADFDGAAAEAIAPAVPRGSELANPLDVPTLGDPSVFSNALAAVAASGACDVVLAVVTTLAHDYDQLSEAPYANGVPVVLTHLSPEERFSPEQAHRLTTHGVATVPDTRGAVAGLDIWASAGFRPPAALVAPLPTPVSERQLGLADSVALLAPFASGRWFAPVRRVSAAAEAVKAAQAFGGPVALKADGERVSHRTERGAVRLNISGAKAVREAYEHVRARAEGDPVVVQPMAPGGLELMVSVVTDPEVGVAAICRAGGVMVELGGPNVILTGPAQRWPELLAASPLAGLLDGWRGSEPADAAALCAFLADMVTAVETLGNVELVECNPVIVHGRGRGLTVVDVLTRPAAQGGS